MKRVVYNLLETAFLLCVTIAILLDTCEAGVEGEIRLVGGHVPHEGTVIIFHNGKWGSVCDETWDIRDAAVVCNALGFEGAKEAVDKSKFGRGRSRVWLSGLHCRGNERHLTMCYSRGWGNTIRKCKSYWSSAGVICNPKEETTTSPKPSPTTTIKRTTTGTTTTITTTKRPPTTTKEVIRSTTERKPSPTTTRKTAVDSSSSPPSTTRSSTRRPSTTRKPTTTTRRPTTTTRRPTTTTRRPTTTTPREYNRWIYNREMWRYYKFFRDGSFITSRPDPRYYRNMRNTTTSSTTTTTTTTTTPRPRRLVNRIHNAVGGDNDNVIRSSNDVSNDLDAPNEIRRHPSRTRQHNSIQKEGYVQDQPPEVAETAAQPEVKTDDSMDVVPGKQVTPSNLEFRLTGGRDYRNYKEGRLEVRVRGSDKWGVVCGDNWDKRAGIVACKHVGAGYMRSVSQTSHYGGENQDKVIATIRCTGHEERLEDCTLETHEMVPGRPACSRPDSVAGVICDKRLPDLEPDLKAVEESIFLRDRYLYYLQCAYEENCLSSSATALYGTSNWSYATRRLLHFSTIAKNIGTADFRPDIDRSQWEWHACHQHYHSMESFSHYDIIDEHGNQIAEGHKASFCLEDTSCDRGVFPKYECQGFGHQGISVGCQDSYLADIDCQWIDVTDVKPGSYTLQIELNPSMKVPEISYDNNVARCKLYFSTRTATVSDCKLASLL